jgi:hypothetical protein
MGLVHALMVQRARALEEMVTAGPERLSSAVRAMACAVLDASGLAL